MSVPVASNGVRRWTLWGLLAVLTISHVLVATHIIRTRLKDLAYDASEPFPATDGVTGSLGSQRVLTCKADCSVGGLLPAEAAPGAGAQERRGGGRSSGSEGPWWAILRHLGWNSGQAGADPGADGEGLDQGNSTPEGRAQHSRSLKHAVMSHSTAAGATSLSSTSSTVIFCDTSGGGLTVTLPAVASMSEGSKAMRYYTIINKATSSSCTVATTSGQSIVTNLHTTSWTDNSPYDRVYGGTNPTGSGSTAVFTDTSTMAPIYHHNAATLPVTTNYNAAAGMSTVISGVTSSGVNVQETVPAPTVTVAANVVTAGQQCVYGYSWTSSGGSRVTDVGLSGGVNVARRTGGLTYGTQNCMRGVSINHNHNYSPTTGKWVATYPDGWNGFPVTIITQVSFGNLPTSVTNGAVVTSVGIANTYTCYTGVSRNFANTVVAVSYQQSAACLASVNSGNLAVVQQINNDPTPVVAAISTSTASVVKTVPTLSSSATLTTTSVATAVSGNVAVSHHKSLRSPTTVAGSIFISDATSAATTTSINLKPGASITLISDGTAWYQIAGSYGETTSLM